MFVSEISIPVSDISGVGKTMTAQLKKLGVQSIGQLLQFFPRTWEDRSQLHTLADWNKHKKINVELIVTAHDWFGFGKMRTLKLQVSDKSGATASLICFNRSFMQNTFPVGSKVLVYGSFYYKYGELQSSAFDIEKTEKAQIKILPIYPLTAGLGQAKLRKVIRVALKNYARGIDSELPENIIKEYNLATKQEALFLMHEPKTMKDIEKAHYSLVFEEFFLFQYMIGKRSLERRGRLPKLEEDTKSKLTKSTQGLAQPDFSPLQLKLLARLPFELTNDQLVVSDEINQDLSGLNPMARLLQGDVGSGKTLVAFLACLKVIEEGGQTAFLAPTEMLAIQHAENAAKLLEPLGIRLAFLSGNTKAKGRTNLLRELKAGNIDLIIGTHSLFSQGVNYNNLRLAIIDEQHRFGVMQRSAIIQKGIESNQEKTAPHILMMSATPIPRTLALSVFGDLDISTIKTMPVGRKPIITYVASQQKAERVYSFVGEEILKGRQAYFVYPLIEDNEEFNLKSAETSFKELKVGFPNHKVALVHSKIPESEQREIMENFKSGDISILIATSVVEVGVDVPNASCMVIEHAERFGLSALHQLRGRIGRGCEQSYCILMYGDKLTETGHKRLEIMKETNDGFRIAEEDLKLRGPGDIGGIEQSGYLGFKIADPIRDSKILQEARAVAFKLLANE